MIKEYLNQEDKLQDIVKVNDHVTIQKVKRKFAQSHKK